MQAPNAAAKMDQLGAGESGTRAAAGRRDDASRVVRREVHRPARSGLDALNVRRVDLLAHKVRREVLQADVRQQSRDGGVDTPTPSCLLAHVLAAPTARLLDGRPLARRVAADARRPRAARRSFDWFKQLVAQHDAVAASSSAARAATSVGFDEPRRRVPPPCAAPPAGLADKAVEPARPFAKPS